jgi:hypothetical protein
LVEEAVREGVLVARFEDLLLLPTLGDSYGEGLEAVGCCRWDGPRFWVLGETGP